MRSATSTAVVTYIMHLNDLVRYDQCDYETLTQLGSFVNET